MSPICNIADPNYPNYNYTINLTVTDDLGCKNNLPLSIDIVCEPIADFIHNDICIGQPDNATYQFIDNSNVTPNSYYWDFGDTASGANNNSADPSPTHTFSGTGQFWVELTIISGSSVQPF